MKILDHLEKIRAFVAVVEKGTLGEAAELLHLTQPSLTRSIQKLEEVLNIKLFLRERRGMKLTKAGEIFYDSCLKVIKEVEDSSQKMHQPNDLMTGQITVGTYESLAEYLWPSFLVETAKAFPHLNLCIKTYSPNNHMKEFYSGLIDILVDAEPRMTGDVSSFPLYSDRFAFYASPKLKISSLKPESAVDFPILYVPTAFDEKNISIGNHLLREGYRFLRTYNFDSFSTIKRMAIMGLGIAVLPKRLASEDISKGHLKSIKLEGFSREGFGPHRIYASFSNQGGEDPRIKVLFRSLKTHLQHLSS